MNAVLNFQVPYSGVVSVALYRTRSVMLHHPFSWQREYLSRVEEVRVEKQRGELFRGEATRPERSDTSLRIT